MENDYFKLTIKDKKISSTSDFTPVIDVDISLKIYPEKFQDLFITEQNQYLAELKLKNLIFEEFKKILNA